MFRPIPLCDRPTLVSAVTNGWFKNCTNRCIDGTKTCDCDFMPGQKVFLNDQARTNSMTAGSALYEPWVVETWRRHSESIGGPAIAEAVRKNLLDPLGAKQRAYHKSKRKN